VRVERPREIIGNYPVGFQLAACVLASVWPILAIALHLNVFVAMLPIYLVNVLPGIKKSALIGGAIGSFGPRMRRGELIFWPLSRA